MVYCLCSCMVQAQETLSMIDRFVIHIQTHCEQFQADKDKDSHGGTSQFDVIQILEQEYHV